MQNTPATSSTAPRIRQAVRTTNAKTAPPALPRAPLLHGLTRAVLWQLAACGTGLLLSAGQVYGGAAPFGLGLLLGCGNTYAPAAALGCLAGLLLFQPLDTALKLAGACIGALTARIVGRHYLAGGERAGYGYKAQSLGLGYDGGVGVWGDDIFCPRLVCGPHLIGAQHSASPGDYARHTAEGLYVSPGQIGAVLPLLLERHFYEAYPSGAYCRGEAQKGIPLRPPAYRYELILPEAGK